MPSANIATSGGLLTDDFIALLRDEDCRHPAAAAAAFALKDKGEPRRLEQEIALTYELLRARYEPLRQRLPNMDITELRQKWLLPVLRDLGYEPVFLQSALRIGAGDDAPAFRFSHRGWDGGAAPVIHSLAWKQDMDKRPASPRGARSPHDTLQSYLNLANQHLWSILTDGACFRLLRDYHQTLTKGYVEVDLAAVLESGDYGDFHAFYRLMHPSRFLPYSDGKCPLELFKDDSQQTGIEVGKRLRNQVHAAIECLGNAFLKADPTLVARLQASPKENMAYYNEILHLIYRLLFLFFVEQRGWIPAGLAVYWSSYSVSGLRDRSLDPYAAQDDHMDLWEGLKSTFRVVREGLKTPSGEITAYGGRLFNDKFMGTLVARGCRNADLLAAIRLLSYFEHKKVPQRINYARLEIDALGSVYESLLDYAPRVLTRDEEVDAKSCRAGEFVLDPNSLARKTSGSHYTPRTLVMELIESALRPVIRDRMETIGWFKKRAPDAALRVQAEKAILAIKVCDKACGSGAFLQAAMDCLGMELARIRIGEESDPTEEQLRQARRDVLQHCIYGVDLNPMAVELCKVTLWIHAAMPRMPLTFLDHRIRCGNSLIGVPTPQMVDRLRRQYDEQKQAAALMVREAEAKYGVSKRGRKGSSSGRKGGKPQALHGTQDLPMSIETNAVDEDIISLQAIQDDLKKLRKDAATEYIGWPDAIPDGAFAPVTGDHEATAREILKRHKQERGSRAEQLGLSYKIYTETALDAFREFEGLTQDNAGDVERKAQAWERWHEQAVKSREHQLADLWTAAFFWRHREGVLLAPTQTVFNSLRREERIDERIAREVVWLAETHRFFHWHLEFPEVFGNTTRGFDCILGNPPWEMVELNEKEFFAPFDGRFAVANLRQRQLLIHDLATSNPTLYGEFELAKRTAAQDRKFAQVSGQFALTTVGRINNYTLFAERAISLISEDGRAGLILPLGSLSMSTTRSSSSTWSHTSGLRVCMTSRTL